MQLPRLSEELFELLHGGSRIRNVAMGARRENPCHPLTPQLDGCEVVRVRTPGQAAYAFPAHELPSRRELSTGSERSSKRCVIETGHPSWSLRSQTAPVLHWNLAKGLTQLPVASCQQEAL